MRLAGPDEVDFPVLTFSAAMWSGVLAIDHARSALALALGLMAVILGQRRWKLIGGVMFGLILGVGSGLLAQQRTVRIVDHAVPGGPVAFVAEAITDSIPGPFGPSVVVVPVEVGEGRLPSSAVAVAGWSGEDVKVGDRYLVEGVFDPKAFRLRRHLVAGRVSGRTIGLLRTSSSPHLTIANALRSRIVGSVDPGASQARALVAGFLIGDTSGVSELTLEAMRRSGLTHYVAVSGSNVALFLMLWWIVLAPLRLGAWLRPVAGLGGLVVFAAMTRWEPSVIRAAVAAGVLLVARAVGIPLSTWATLALAVAGCLLLAGELATDIGFQLSVLATIGVLVGSKLFAFRPRSIATGLSAAVSAQLFVAPVLIGNFGTLPLLSPLANVIAGPFVVAATTIGGVGALIGSGSLVRVGAMFATGVLQVAETASPWPQIGGGQLFWLAVGGIALWGIARRIALPVAALLVAVAIWPVNGGPAEPAVVFLDVGQGDSTLLLGEGFTVLVDGGPDPVILDRKLNRYGVTHIDVVVVSHVHADHIRGLEAVLGSRSVGVVLADFDHHSTPASEWLIRESETHGIDLLRPSVGASFGIPTMTIEVAGPLRRYASPNDESVVLIVSILGDRILLSGDIETFAQAEVEVADIDVLKVPHQGAATSSEPWLAKHAGRLAVVSVGPNTFGHPAEWVVTALEDSGARVHRTDLDGDLVYRPLRSGE